MEIRFDGHCVVAMERDTTEKVGVLVEILQEHYGSIY